MNTYLDSRPSRGAITTLILSAVLWQGVSAALGSQSSLRRIATAFAASVNPSDDVTWHQEAVDSALREAEAHIERLDYFGAKWILEQALRSNPASAALLRKTAMLLNECLENPSEAIVVLDRLIAVSPGAHDYFERANIRFKQGKHKDAIVDLDKALALNPMLDEAFRVRANARFVSGDLDGAVTDIVKQASIRGEAEVDANSIRAHHDALQRARKAGNKDPEVVRERADAWYEIEAYSLALHEYELLLKLGFADDTTVLFRAGIAADEIGDQKKAEDYLSRYLRLEPGDSNIFATRGFIRTRLGNYDAAIADFDRAIELNPKNAQAFGNRAIVRWAQAARDAARARELHERTSDKGGK